MYKKKTYIFSIIFVFLAIAIFTMNSAIAQKSTGTIRGEIINKPVTPSPKPAALKGSNKPVVKNKVTRSVNDSQNSVRFLLRPKNEAMIASQMNGVISDIKFNVGQRFKKGDVLISLQCGIQNAQLSAQKARMQEALLTHKSNQELLAGNAVSQYEVDITKAQFDQQKSLLSESNIIASLCRVKAPFSGGVVSVDVNEFETVSSGTPLLNIIDDSALVMSLNIPSSLINKVKKNNFFTIEVDETSNSYKAQVTGVSPAIDPVSKTIELRAALVKKSPELKPGMSGSAKLNFSQK